MKEGVTDFKQRKLKPGHPPGEWPQEQSLFVLENLGKTQNLEPAGVTQKQCEARGLTESLPKRKLELQVSFPPLHSRTMGGLLSAKWSQRDSSLRHLTLDTDS